MRPSGEPRTSDCERRVLGVAVAERGDGLEVGDMGGPPDDLGAEDRPPVLEAHVLGHQRAAFLEAMLAVELDDPHGKFGCVVLEQGAGRPARQLVEAGERGVPVSLAERLEPASCGPPRRRSKRMWSTQTTSVPCVSDSPRFEGEEHRVARDPQGSCEHRQRDVAVGALDFDELLDTRRPVAFDLAMIHVRPPRRDHAPDDVEVAARSVHGASTSKQRTSGACSAPSPAM